LGETVEYSIAAGVRAGVSGSGAPNVTCFRLGRDIAIPQMQVNEHLNLTSPPLSRPFDSTFAGSMWGDRGPLIWMAMEGVNNQSAVHNGMERFKGGSISEAESIDRAYFGYHPCGVACWSQRLYSYLYAGTIPIIVSSGTVQPFERWLDWSSFTIKISPDTWNDLPKLISFRKQLRVEADVFRDRLDAFHRLRRKGSEPNQDRDHAHDMSDKMSMHEIERYAREHQRVAPAFRRLQETLIWRKIRSGQAAMEWLHFVEDFSERDRVSPKHAMRLLTLEMWCNARRICDGRGGGGGARPGRDASRRYMCGLHGRNRSAYEEYM
jgi:hypothetical protein